MTMNPLVLLLVAGVFLGGCAAPPPPAAPAPAQPGPEIRQPKRGGTFQFLARFAPGNLHLWTQGFGITVIGKPVYDTLVALDYSSTDIDYRVSETLVPRLAERWELSPDGKTVTFFLRKGVQWHDGAPFTADDVVFSLDYARDSKNGFIQRALVRSVDRVERVDDHTVRVVLSQPDPELLSNLAPESNPLAILPKHMLDRGQKYEQVAIGTGPFRLESHDATKASVLVKNENYWEEGKPYLDRIHVFQNMERGAEIAAFTAKQIDIIHPGDKAILQTLQASNREMQWGTVLQNLIPFFAPLQDRPPFDNVQVRRAIQLAIDRHAMNQTASFGDGVIAPPAVWAKDPRAIPQGELLQTPGFRKEKEQDLAEAKRLLAEAGFPTGFTTSLDYPQAHSTAPKLAEIAAAQLKAIGITVNLKPLENAVYNQMETQGGYQGIVFQRNSGNRSSGWLNLFHSRGVKNTFRINDPELDAVIDAEGKEPDEARKKELWLKFQRLLIDKAYAWPTIDFANYAAWQPWVHGYRYTLSANITLAAAQNIWLDTEAMPSDRR